MRWILAIAVLACWPGLFLESQDEPKPATISENATQPAITCDKAGNVYVVFGQGPQDTRQVMLAVSKDAGKTFGNPERVSVDAFSCMAGMERGPRVAVLPDGAIAVTCFAKLAKGDENHLYCYRKGLKDKAFKGVRVTTAQAKDSESMHDMCADAEGNLHVVWLDSRNTSRGNHPWYARSDNGGKVFKGEIQTYTSLGGSICPCCCPSISVSEDGKSVVIQFRNKLKGADGADYNDMYAAISTGGGKRFNPAIRIDSRERWKG